MNDKRPAVPERSSAESRQLAATRDGSSSGRDVRSRLVRGMIWCLIGSALVAVVPVLANVMVAFGAAIAMSGGGRRERAAAYLGGIAMGCASTGLLVGAYDLPMTVTSVLCACAVADGVVRDRLRTGSLLLLVTAVTWAMMGTDMVSTSLQGTSIGELVTNVVNPVVEASEGSLDLSGTAALIEARDAMVVYWPTLYFVVGVALALSSLLGSLMGARASGAGVRAGMLVRYDVPLWVAVVFALGVAIQLVGPHLPSWQDGVAMVGANVVMCARLALAQQGLSVLLWWMAERRAPSVARAMAVLAALWLEMSFALTSVVGLLDVGLNFRHMERRRPDLVRGPGGER